MSRGGRNAYTWATANPDKVSCIYADNPGVNPDVLKKLGDLAAADVPLLHVCGSIDPLLGRSSGAIETIVTPANFAPTSRRRLIAKNLVFAARASRTSVTNAPSTRRSRCMVK